MDKEQKILKKLYSYPSLLKSLPIVEKLSNVTIEQIIHKSEILTKPYDNDMENTRAWNFVGFMYYILGDKEKAFEYIDKTLDNTKTNINAFVLKSWFYLKQGDYFNSDKELKSLGNPKRNSLEFLYAKAELAFTYSRLGIPAYTDAEELFMKVLEEVDRDKVPVPPNNVVTWRFGLAVVIKRGLNIHNVHGVPHLDLKGKYQRVLDIHLDIVNMERVKLSLVAMSYVEIGLVLDSIEQNEREFPTGTSAFFNRNTPTHLCRSVYYIKRALEDGPCNVFVIERCGKYYRYHGDVEKSVELLRRAIEIGETPFNHHHLALSLKRQLEMNCRKTKPFYKPIQNWGASRDATARGNYNRGGRWNENMYRGGRGRGNYNGVGRGDENMYRGGRGRGYRRGSARGNYNGVGPGDENLYRGESARSNYNGVGRGKEKIYRGDSARGNYNEQNMIKSPRNMHYIEENGNESVIEEILYHLDKSVELGGNQGALYDKALVHRALGRYDEAIKVFTEIFQQEASLVHLANSYEQAGFCMIDQAENAQNPNEKEKLKYNSKINLMKSMEISCKLVTKIKSLNTCWASAPTLKKLLLGQAKTKETYKDLGDLHMKIRCYGQAIVFYQEVISLEDDDDKKADIYQRMVRTFIEANHYDEAILTFGMLLCLPDGYGKVDRSLYIRAHIEGGLDAYRKRENKMAELRIRNALEFDNETDERDQVASSRNDRDPGQVTSPRVDRDPGQVPSPSGDTDPRQVASPYKYPEHFDIFIMCNEADEASENQARTLRIAFTNMGLEVTLNDDHVRDDSKLRGIADIMGRSSVNVILGLDGSAEATDSWPELIYLTPLILKRERVNTVLVKRSTDSAIPLPFSTIPNIIFDSRIDSEISPEHLSADQLSWMEDLLMQLTMRSK